MPRPGRLRNSNQRHGWVKIIFHNGAFENGNIGALTRRVPTDRVVTALPPLRGIPKPPKEPRTPRVVELLRKGIGFRADASTNQCNG